MFRVLTFRKMYALFRNSGKLLELYNAELYHPSLDGGDAFWPARTFISHGILGCSNVSLKNTKVPNDTQPFPPKPRLFYASSKRLSIVLSRKKRYDINKAHSCTADRVSSEGSCRLQSGGTQTCPKGELF